MNLHSAIAISLATLGAVGCAGGPEEAILEGFFAAARLRDKTALASFAVVAFEPQISGIVTEFDLKNVTPERRTPLTTEMLRQAWVAPTAPEAVAQLSLDHLRNRVDVTRNEGEVVSKDLTVEAPVRVPDGRTVQKTFVVTIQRAVLKGDEEIVGRWIVTSIRDTN